MINAVPPNRLLHYLKILKQIIQSHYICMHNSFFILESYIKRFICAHVEQFKRPTGKPVESDITALDACM